MDEVAELKTLSEFIQARAAIAPTGGRALNEFLAAMRKELAELDVKSFCGQTLVDALIDRIDTRLRFEKLKKTDHHRANPPYYNSVRAGAGSSACGYKLGGGGGTVGASEGIWKKGRRRFPG